MSTRHSSETIYTMIRQAVDGGVTCKLQFKRQVGKSAATLWMLFDQFFYNHQYPAFVVVPGHNMKRELAGMSRIVSDFLRYCEFKGIDDRMMSENVIIELHQFVKDHIVAARDLPTAILGHLVEPAFVIFDEANNSIGDVSLEDIPVIIVG